jgi:hypothetical protein
MIEHLSGSSMNTFDNNIHEYYTVYVLWEEPEYNYYQAEAMEYGKVYEIELGKKLGSNWNTQKKLEVEIWWYTMIGLLDFINEKWLQVIECKTKSGERKEKDIHTSRQFRFYNWWCNEHDYQFILHQFNKKNWEIKEDTINWIDKDFEKDFIEKAGQIERFLKQFNILLKRDLD